MRYLILCLFILLPCGISFACAPGQYQDIFSGIVWNIKVRPNDELRVYLEPVQESVINTTTTVTGAVVENTGTESLQNNVEQILMGATSENPGRLQDIYGRNEFSLYACGESTDILKGLEFRYARGQVEYLVEVQEGSPVFNGRLLNISGGSFDTQPGSGFLLRVTRKIYGETVADGVVDSTILEAPTPVYGDFNGDYIVDSDDAALVLHHVYFDGGQDLTYDLNGDGMVSMLDVREVYEIMRGGGKQSSVTKDSLLRYIIFVGGNEARFDINGDGRVNSTDLRSMYQEQVELPIVTADSILHFILFGDRKDADYYDVNGDGVVNISDVQAVYPQQDAGVNLVDAPAAVAHYIVYRGGSDKRYDINGDGVVDAADIQALAEPARYPEVGGRPQLTVPSVTPSPDNAAGVLRYVLYIGGNDRAFDKNGDGVVNLDDVSSFMRSQ